MRLSGRDVLVVGGGDVAARKCRLLARSNARLRVVAPGLCAELAEAAEAGRLNWRPVAYSEAEFGQPALVIAATDDAALNRRIAEDADARGVPVNVVDMAQASSVIMPAIVDRSPIVIALSSGGTAPVLARRLRDRIEKMLPAGFGRVAEVAGALRQRVSAQLPEPMRRLRFWEDVFDGPLAERIAAAGADEGKQLLEQRLSAARESLMPAGEVFLVGVGPGDPDLLTLRAHRLMQLADVVLHDRLIPDAIMEMVRRDAERIDVGKRRSRHTLPQADINTLLVDLARQGRRVLRLKGGDPFMFGRGGEEIETLMAAGVPFQVVPGVTAALGCAAYAGIPLTHRDHAHSCVFVTGHPREDGELALDWDTLARPNQTVVVYMGLTLLERICASLIAAGLPADWPAAMVFNGTRPDQLTLASTLEELPQRVAETDEDGPGLLIVGQVVSLRHKLDWLRLQTGLAS